MISRIFLLRYIVFSLTLILVIVGTNYYIDIYGLFLGRTNRRVYINERTTKYLFSMRYIPENFEGIVIGPSLSANLNTANITKFNVYNASIMGANISELNYLVENIVKLGNLKFVIICLGPYLTKDHGRKSSSIDPVEYYGALGSTNLLKTYLLYFVRKYRVSPARYAPELYNSYGWNNFELEMRNLSPKDTIERKIALRDYGETTIDTVAFNELRKTINLLNRKGIKVVGYFSPVPYGLYKIGEKNFKSFENRIQSLFSVNDIVLNLNSENYRAINEDFSTFIDHGHLSANGQKFVLNILDSTLVKNFMFD